MKRLYSLREQFSKRFTAVLLAGVLMILGTSAVQAKERIGIAIISFSPYAPWYIVKEKGMLKNIDLDIQIIEDITAKNAALSSGNIQCMLNTMDSIVVAKSARIPMEVIAVSDKSFGLDQMVVIDEIRSVKDFPGKSYGADYAFLNHMWMLLTLKKAGIGFNDLSHRIMLPQESAAAFTSGHLDIDVNYMPFSYQSLQRPNSRALKSSFTDKTWERGLISDVIACNQNWLKKKPEQATDLLRAWFEAVNWWKENPEEGNKIIAAGLGWPVSDVEMSQHGAIMPNLEQNLGAFEVGDNRPVCASLPEGIPEIPAEPSGWGAALFNGAPDCAAGYLSATWDLFGKVYQEADVLDKPASAQDGLNSSILKRLHDEGASEKFNSNKWIGRIGIN